MVDGIDLSDRCCVVALGLDIDVKVVPRGPILGNEARIDAILAERTSLSAERLGATRERSGRLTPKPPSWTASHTESRT
jgi:hypothetical protein